MYIHITYRLVLLQYSEGFKTLFVTSSSCIAMLNFPPPNVKARYTGLIQPSCLFRKLMPRALCSESRYLCSGIVCTVVLLFLKQIQKNKRLSDELLQAGVTPLR